MKTNKINHSKYLGVKMEKVLVVFFTVLFSYSVVYCQSENKLESTIEKYNFGKLVDGIEVTAFTLKNANGMTAKIIDYGASVVSLTAPDRNGNYADVVLGYDNLEGYVKGASFFGGIVGRYGNRIGKGKMTIDEKEYQLATNNGKNHLHGGVVGYNKKLWTVNKTEVTSKGPAITLTLISEDGDENYPGTVKLTVVYTLTNDNSLSIEYTGTTDKTTVLNPTNHSYFNLSGDMNKTILDHELMIDADKTTPVDAGLITTGELADVAGTPMDFRTAKKIGKDISADDEQLKFGGGYDHNWVVNNYDEKVKLISTLYEPKSGRLMETYSDEPGLQFYSGNFLDGTITGKSGIKYKYRTGLCLEAQHYPDSPNKPQFPSVLLKPGETYSQTTIYKFSVKK
ncbi:MAG: aldose epimerase family protein [bacterium]